jgi:hypothetical protein
LAARIEEQRQQLASTYDEQLDALVALKFDLLELTYDLDQRNAVLDSEAWPEVEILRSELAEIDLKIQALTKRLQVFEPVVKEVMGWMADIEAQTPFPKIAPEMAVHSKKSACELTVQSLKMRKRNADLRQSAEQIACLFNECRWQLAHIQNHPRANFSQRIDLRARGQTKYHLVTGVFHKMSRYLVTANAPPQPEDHKDNEVDTDDT